MLPIFREERSKNDFFFFGFGKKASCNLLERLNPICLPEAFDPGVQTNWDPAPRKKVASFSKERRCVYGTNSLKRLHQLIRHVAKSRGIEEGSIDATIDDTSVKRVDIGGVAIGLCDVRPAELAYA